MDKLLTSTVVYVLRFSDGHTKTVRGDKAYRDIMDIKTIHRYLYNNKYFGNTKAGTKVQIEMYIE